MPKTGQTTSYTAYDDGALQKGVAWPDPRFVDNSNGTVTDNLTALVWLKDAGCTKFWAADPLSGNSRSVANGAAAAHNLAGGVDCGGGSDCCGLDDGSEAGDWRLPNIKELLSLLDYGKHSPALSRVGETTETYFDNVVSTGIYWSSMADAGVTYWYKLEDIGQAGDSAFHGPVSATPDAGWDVSRAEAATVSQAGSRTMSKGLGMLGMLIPPAVAVLLLRRRRRDSRAY